LYGSAQRGTFNGTTWNSKGFLSTINDTIEVVNGELAGNIDIVMQIWRLNNAVSLTAPTVVLPKGQTITAQGWQTSDNGSSGWTNFTLPATASMTNDGKYLRYYATGGGQTYYSNTVNILVLSATQRAVTIDMFAYTGGWAGSSALRILVNGAQTAAGIKVQTTAANNTPSGQTGTNTYTFAVNAGDTVQLYWVATPGAQQQYFSFIVYYYDTPPSPAFTSINNNNWNGVNALVYRLRGTATDGTTLQGVANGDLLDGFTATAP